jgi:TetR/AcrR family transcriptional regulator, transcriptional repressor for nem operon
MARTADTGTAERILDVAEALVQSRGFNGFSYADVAEALGITKAALHYHFPGKAELGEALVERYARRFGDALVTVDRDELDGPAKLRAYARLYADVFQDDRMCLCGMLAADYATLPDPMRERVVGFFDDNERWLARVLEAGRSDGSLRFQGTARGVARTLVGGLEGAMLVARPYGDVRRFRAAAALLVDGVVAD